MSYPWRDALLRDRLSQAAIELYLRVETPFSRFLEVPRSYQLLGEAFAQSFAERTDSLRHLHLDFLVALYEGWYGDRTQQTISSDLLMCGFDATAVFTNLEPTLQNLFHSRPFPGIMASTLRSFLEEPHYTHMLSGEITQEKRKET